jgi:hypothetical protein
MAQDTNDDEIYEEAKAIVKAKKDFYRDLITWAVVNTVLVIIWALSGRGYPWFLWPLGIWGAFVLFHFIRVFVFEQKSDKGAIEKEAENIRRKRR